MKIFLKKILRLIMVFALVGGGSVCAMNKKPAWQVDPLAKDDFPKLDLNALGITAWAEDADYDKLFCDHLDEIDKWDKAHPNETSMYGREYFQRKYNDDSFQKKDEILAAKLRLLNCHRLKFVLTGTPEFFEEKMRDCPNDLIKLIKADYSDPESVGVTILTYVQDEIHGSERMLRLARLFKLDEKASQGVIKNRVQGYGGTGDNRDPREHRGLVFALDEAGFDMDAFKQGELDKMFDDLISDLKNGKQEAFDEAAKYLNLQKVAKQLLPVLEGLKDKYADKVSAILDRVDNPEDLLPLMSDNVDSVLKQKLEQQMVERARRTKHAQEIAEIVWRYKRNKGLALATPFVVGGLTIVAIAATKSAASNQAHEENNTLQDVITHDQDQATVDEGLDHQAREEEDLCNEEPLMNSLANESSLVDCGLVETETCPLAVSE